MANNVVGNYDVVVQVSLAAVDRFLAVMHECGRFLHSTSGYVNDVAPPPVHLPPHPILPPIVFTGVEDAFGNAIANQRQIPRRPFTGTVAVNNVLSALRPPIVNPGWVIFPPPVIIPSNLSGHVQLQVFPPTIDVPDASGTNLSVTLNAMVRYFPDPNTAPIAQFLRGNLQIVAPINQISTQVGNVIEFDFKAEPGDRQLHADLYQQCAEHRRYRGHQSGDSERAQDQLPALERHLTQRRLGAAIQNPALRLAEGGSTIAGSDQPLQRSLHCARHCPESRPTISPLRSTRTTSIRS